MRKCCALRQSRGAAGELDIHGVIHLDRSRQGFQSFVTSLLASLCDPVERHAAIVLPRNRDDVSQFRKTRAMQLATSASQLRGKLANHRDIVAGLEASSGYQRATSHGSQDVFQLTQAIGGIDIDQNQTSLRRRKLRDRPFRAVWGPNADAIPRLQTERQKPGGERVGTHLELRVGPANFLVRNNQRFAGPVRRTHLVQESADGLPDQRRTAITMHITFAWHEYLRYMQTRSLFPRSIYLPSNTRVGGSISLLKASAVLTKPRCESGPSYSSMATSSITRSAAATPPLDQALSNVRVAAYDLVGPVASCLANADAVSESSFSGTTCVAIPSAPASRP